MQGVLSKSRTWQYAQKGIDKVMSLCAEEEMNWSEKCPSIYAIGSMLLSQQSFVQLTLMLSPCNSWLHAENACTTTLNLQNPVTI